MVLLPNLPSGWRGGRLKARSAGPSSGVLDSGDPEWGPGIHISNKFPGDTDVPGPGTTLKNALSEFRCWVLDSGCTLESSVEIFKLLPRPRPPL